MHLDIRTLLIVVVFGHAVCALVVGLQGVQGERSLVARFMAARIGQAAGWALLSQRGAWPDLVTAHLGNGLLLAGFTLESMALARAAGVAEVWSRRLLCLGLGALVLFWMLGRGPTDWVVISSVGVGALFGATAVALLKDGDGSGMHSALGWVYALVALMLLVRAVFALAPGSTLVLLSPGTVQTLAFLPLIVLMIAGGVGFALLLVERAAWRLRESEARFSSLFRLSPVPMLITRIEDGLVEDCNEAMIRLSGHRRGEVLGRSVLELNVFPDPAARSRLVETVRTEGVLRDHEMSFRTASGELLEGLVNATWVKTGGRITLLSCVQDITARKQEARERETVIRELQEALGRVRTLSGLLPMCAACKKIRDDNGYWNQLEAYLVEHSDAAFTHGLCPECSREFLKGLDKEG